MNSEAVLKNDPQLDCLSRDLDRVDPDISAAIRSEKRRQQDQVELIASENIVSQAVLEVAG